MILTTRKLFKSYKVEKEREVTGKSAKVRAIKKQMRESLNDAKAWIPSRDMYSDLSFCSYQVYVKFQRPIKDVIEEMFPNIPDVGFFINKGATFGHMGRILLTDGLVWKLTNIYDFELLKHVITEYADIMCVSYADVCTAILDGEPTERYLDACDLLSDRG